MNRIDVDVSFSKGILEFPNKIIDLVTGDYNSTKMIFNFDIEEGIKIFEMKNPDGLTVFSEVISNNEILLGGKTSITTIHENKIYKKYTLNENIYWYQEEESKLYDSSWNEISSFNINDYTNELQDCSIFNMSGEYIFEIHLTGVSSRLTSLFGALEVREEQVLIDDTIVAQYLPVFDSLIQIINTAINQVNNLNIEVKKQNKVTKVTLTKKDGQQEIVEINDGEKGDKGDTGDCNFATFEVDLTDGELYLNKPEELTDIDFEINNNGELEVIL